MQPTYLIGVYMNRNKLLFLASIPATPELEKELSQIEDTLSKAKFRDQFEPVIFKIISTLDEFGNYIRKETPDIFHFSGHGHSDGELKVGGQYVPNEYLAELFAEVSNKVQCVILNGCYSEHQARYISSNISCVVGTKDAIRHPTVIKFTREFYQSLGEGANVNSAFLRARNFVMADDIRTRDRFDYFSLLPTKESGQGMFLAPVSRAETIISTLDNARFQGEEGHRNNGDFYTYDVWLDNTSLQTYRHLMEAGHSLQEYKFSGRWHSHIYKEVNMRGIRLDKPWGNGAKPNSDFSFLLKAVDSKLNDLWVTVNRNDDSRNNYAASKVEQLINSEINKLMN